VLLAAGLYLYTESESLSYIICSEVFSKNQEQFYNVGRIDIILSSTKMTQILLKQQ
jgi:hypothetical protein